MNTSEWACNIPIFNQNWDKNMNLKVSIQLMFMHFYLEHLYRWMSGLLQKTTVRWFQELVVACFGTSFLPLFFLRGCGNITYVLAFSPLIIWCSYVKTNTDFFSPITGHRFVCLFFRKRLTFHPIVSLKSLQNKKWIKISGHSIDIEIYEHTYTVGSKIDQKVL